MQQEFLKRTVSWDTTDRFKVALLVKKIIITPTNSAYLSSCLDVHGVIGVFRRLRFFFHSENSKRPVPVVYFQRHHTLVILYNHLNLLHAGFKLTMTMISRRFWIMLELKAIRRVNHTCIPSIW